MGRPMQADRPLLHPARTTGRGEVVRLTLALAGVEWREERIATTLKPQEPPCPHYTDEHVELCQGSAATTRHLGRLHDLYGESLREQALIDRFLDVIDDVRRKYVVLMHGQALFGIGDGAARLVYWEDVMEPPRGPAAHLGPHFRCLSELLKSNNGGKGWAVGGQPSIADPALYHIVDLHCRMFGDEAVLVLYPELVGFKRRFAQLPRIAAFLSTRTREH